MNKTITTFAAAAAQPPLSRFGVEGGDFRAELTDGRVLRGAYGHSDRPSTRDGMRVEIDDRIGIQPAEVDPGEPRFEAGWRPEGAACVAHPPVPEHGGLAEIAAREPRLAGRTGPEACTEDRAAAPGALVFNRSRPPG